MLIVFVALGALIPAIPGTLATLGTSTPAAPLSALFTLLSPLSRRALLPAPLRTFAARRLAGRPLTPLILPTRRFTRFFLPAWRLAPHFFARGGTLLFRRLRWRLLWRQGRKPQLTR
jgi:hypothetical protein